MNAQTPVTADMVASTIRGARNSRPRHNSATEIPTSAAIAGASATV